MTKHEILYYEAHKKGYVNESEIRLDQINFLTTLGYLEKKETKVLGDLQTKPKLTSKGKRYIKIVHEIGGHENLRKLTLKEWDYLEKNTMLRRDFLAE